MRSALTTLSSSTAADPCTTCPLDDADDATLTVDRRTAIGKGMLAAVTAALGMPLLSTACMPSTVATTAGGVPLGTWMLQVRVADFPALATTGGIARVDGTSDKPVAVVRLAQGYTAFSMRCTHGGTTIDPQPDGTFLCPSHGAHFSADGKWIDGHAAKNLKVLTVAYDDTTQILTIAG